MPRLFDRPLRGDGAAKEDTSILSFRHTIRSSHRLAQILTVFAKHGFGHLVVSLRLERLVPFRKKLSRKVSPPSDLPEDLSSIASRAANAMEDLGPTFVKLGQALATRPDLLPAEFLSAFRRLQDRCRPFAFEEVRQAVERDFGCPVEDLFSSFDPVPFAQGSIAQVHYATAADGTDVVVKVKRPGIDRTIMDDVSLLQTLAELVERHMPQYRVYRPRMLVDEFAHTLRQELDFVNEAAVTSRFYDSFADDERIGTPRVFWDLSSRDVLTLERLSGAVVSSDTDFAALGIDRPRLARNLLDAFFKQFFELGLFHADPHPGNLLARAPDRWNLLDFGQVGRIDEAMRTRLAMCLMAAVRRELDLVVDILDDLDTLPEDLDRHHFKTGLVTLLDKYEGMPIKRMRITTLFEEVVAMAREHRIVLPQDFVLLGKSLATVGGVAMMLDADCQPLEIITPKLRQLLRDRVSPGRIVRDLGTNAYHVTAMLNQGPQMLRRLLRNLTRGQTRLIFRHEGLDNLIGEIDRSSNRIAFSVITAAIILGSSVILLAKVGPRAGDLAILGLLGFVVAAVSGIWLLISIFRSGRL